MKHATTLSFARRLLAVCATSLFVCAAPFAAQAGSVLDRIQSTGVLKMGYRADGAPFSWETGPSAATGYAPDICQRIAASIASHLKLPKLQVQAVPVLESTRIPAVVNGEIDMECAGTTNTNNARAQAGE